MKTPAKKKQSSGYSRLKTRYEILEDKFKKQEKLLQRLRNYNNGLREDLYDKINRVSELNKEIENLQNSFEITVQALKSSTIHRHECLFAIARMVHVLKEADFFNRKRKVADAISIAEGFLNSIEILETTDDEQS